MIIPFDYIFIRVYDLYKNKWRSDIAIVYALGVITLCQLFNLVALGFILSEYVFAKQILSKVVVIVIFSLLALLNIIRYYNPKKIIMKFENKTKVYSFRNGILVFAYIFLSFVSVFLVPFIIREMR